MKPHEWATRAMADMGAGIREALIQAFKEAILAEREACAKLASDFAKRCVDYKDSYGEGRFDAAEEIEHEINERRD
jgi:hypothetical protein